MAEIQTSWNFNEGESVNPHEFFLEDEVWGFTCKTSPRACPRVNKMHSHRI